jgi:hypothetical protein
MPDAEPSFIWDGNHADTSWLLSNPLSCSKPLARAVGCRQIILAYRPMFDDDDDEDND